MEENGYFKGNIEARVTGLEKSVDEIKTNHLPHIQVAVDGVDTKLDRVVEKMEENMEKNRTWVIALLTSFILMLFGVIANIVVTYVRH